MQTALLFTLHHVMMWQHTSSDVRPWLWRSKHRPFWWWQFCSFLQKTI